MPSIPFLATSILCLICMPAFSQGHLLGGGADEEITIENCEAINTPDVEFGPALLGKRLVYLTRPRRGAVDLATRVPYFRLFDARLDADGAPVGATRFSAALNRDYNLGPASFTQDDRVIYYTGTMAEASRATGTRNLGLFSAYFDGYDWAAVRALPHNDPNFTTQHPALTANGRRMFFASNRPGGFGGYDLYFADYRNGVWGAAVNLGPEINTDGNDAFPFIHPSGELFFASDGHPGLGGYDVFRINIAGRKWGELRALPEPINSPDDDIGFVLRDDATGAYLASNRPGGKGEDDIYQVSLKNGLASLAATRAREETLTVYDAATSRRLAAAEVWIIPLGKEDRLPPGLANFTVTEENGRRTVGQRLAPAAQFTLPATHRTNNLGQVAFTAEAGRQYRIFVVREGFTERSLTFGAGSAAPGSLDLALTAGPATPTAASDTLSAAELAGAILPLPNITYPYFSANFVEEQSPDLRVLLAFARRHPGARLAIISHADGPETEERLEELTAIRAEKIRAYLLAQGIDERRINTVGYGRRLPVRPCSPCTAEDYARNTRIVAKVIDW